MQQNLVIVEYLFMQLKMQLHFCKVKLALNVIFD